MIGGVLYLVGKDVDSGALVENAAPCSMCKRMIINSGIKRVVCKKHYHSDKETIDLFKLARVKLVVISNSIEKYDRQ